MHGGTGPLCQSDPVATVDHDREHVFDHKRAREFDPEFGPESEHEPKSEVKREFKSELEGETKRELTGGTKCTQRKEGSRGFARQKVYNRKRGREHWKEEQVQGHKDREKECYGAAIEKATVDKKMHAREEPQWSREEHQGRESARPHTTEHLQERPERYGKENRSAKAHTGKRSQERQRTQARGSTGERLHPNI